METSGFPSAKITTAKALRLISRTSYVHSADAGNLGEKENGPLAQTLCGAGAPACDCGRGVMHRLRLVHCIVFAALLCALSGVRLAQTKLTIARRGTPSYDPANLKLVNGVPDPSLSPAGQEEAKRLPARWFYGRPLAAKQQRVSPGDEPLIPTFCRSSHPGHSAFATCLHSRSACEESGPHLPTRLT
jgi:hypothetical protein